MARSSLPPYHHCPRCGLTSVNPQHVCDPARLVAPEVRARPEPVATLARRASTEIGDLTVRLREEISRLLGRWVGLMMTDHGRWLVVQLCAACHQEIKVRVTTSVDDYLAMFTAIGASARKSYLIHACPLVEQALVGFTWDELEELHATLERDVVRIGERQQQIEKLRKERG